MEDGTLVEWLVKPGDKVTRGDIIAEVDTQKGLIEIEVFDEGTIEKLLVKENEKVPVGTLLATINDGNKKATPPNKKKQIGSVKPTVKKVQPSTSPVIESRRIKISPLARRIAEQNKIDYTVLTGSGDDGTIVKEDVEKAMGHVGAAGSKKPAIKTPWQKLK